MPKYKYVCEECEGTFVVVHGMDEVIERCYLKNGGENNVTDGFRCEGLVKRIPSTTSFSLKGKGWYKDGY